MTLLDYNQLKQQIVLGVITNDRHSQLFSRLKEVFKEVINSPRRFEQINTIGQLLKVLEIRDALSEDNIIALKEIARRLPNSNELLSKIADYETSHVTREYINHYAAENTQDIQTREPTESFINSNPLSSVMSKRKKQRLYSTIIEEIGIFWRDLGRNLKIREHVIDKIDKEHCSLASKATKLLEVYESKADPQRWFFILCDALEKARRKDLSRLLQEIMTMNI